MPESIWVAPLALAVVTMVALKIFSLAQPLKSNRDTLESRDEELADRN